MWPSNWSLAAQVVLAIFLAEGVSYWQHRLLHRVPWLWRFHALHHSGERLNLIRAGRFHLVDGATGTFMTFLPLVALGAPETMVTWVASRAPAALQWLVCTPAIHRHHHSRVHRESDRNFGTLTTFFDIVFGTFERAPWDSGPIAVGIEDDPVPRGFLNQVLAPFRVRDCSSTRTESPPKRATATTAHR